MSTRIYFSDEAANDKDPVLALVPAERRRTLVAVRDPKAAIYRFDIHFQGDDETVFFEI
jgi:protocatechuate 3,4-dioxygenase alpha subunit